MAVHLAFDLVAAFSAFLMTLAVYRWRLKDHVDTTIGTATSAYLLSLVAGAVAGGFLFGTLNLYLSGVESVGRSILGALAGATLTVEIYKLRSGIHGSTGLIFVPAFATSVTIGRIGCFFAGLPDQTYGTPTSLPWGADFGDGILRHPVQLYESGAMAVFLALALVALYRRTPFFMQNGFYLMVAYYAAQRFVLEFLKPYGSVVGPLNLFHLLCVALLIYAALMMRRTRHVPA